MSPIYKLNSHHQHHKRSMDSFILFLILSFLFIIFLIYKTRSPQKANTKWSRLPLGQMGLPWIGETISFYRAQRKNQLFDTFFQPRIKKHGKIFKTRLMGSPTVVVNGAAANKFFMSNEFKLVISSWPTSSVELMGKNSIMEKQGDSHRCLRGIIASTLGPSGLQEIVPRMCSSILKHLQRNWQNHEEISLHKSTKILTFAIVLECLFGIKIELETMFGVFENVLEGVLAAPINLPGTKFNRAKKARAEIQKVLVDEVRRKREAIERGKDVEDGMLLSNLVAALIKGEVTGNEVVDNIVLLVFAAHDTTSYAITMTFKMLANHPDCYSLLLKEHEGIASTKKEGETLNLEDVKKMEYTWQVARETMRLCPPIFGSFRKATADIEYEGFTIPKGWKVVLWTTYGTHYDEEYFQDPLSFKPSRFADPVQAYAFIPFGGGPRLCAGYQLAKLNILVFMHYVVTRYDWSLVYPDEPIVMDPLPFPSKGMPIKITRKLI